MRFFRLSHPTMKCPPYRLWNYWPESYWKDPQIGPVIAQVRVLPSCRLVEVDDFFFAEEERREPVLVREGGLPFVLAGGFLTGVVVDFTARFALLDSKRDSASNATCFSLSITSSTRLLELSM